MNASNHMCAEPEQESDAEWLHRTVFELTGVEPMIEAILDRCYAISSSGLRTAVLDIGGRGRDADALRRNLSIMRWTLKDSVTGSAGTAEGNSAAPVRSESTGVFGSAQPVAEAICSDCRAPCAETLCIYCSLRSSPKYLDSAEADRTAALPGQVAARERVAAFERRNRPRVTADSVELARPHPWDCDDSLVGD